MNSNSILTSNLLDIIFENRNQEYGAYVLRKNYNKRLAISLCTMLFLVCMFVSWQVFSKKRLSSQAFSGPIIKDPEILSIIPPKKVEPKKITTPISKPMRGLNNRPEIVKEKPENILNDKLVLSGDNTANENTASNEPSTEQGNLNAGPAKSDEPATPVVDKNIPVTADILPQFPGGVNEFIKFLKRNLRVPEEMEDGKEISVRVKFIVNYNGDLLDFIVTQTGGNSYDNEVLRVLKKMPKWIPGKAAGENISTYYIVPVKFTTGD